MILWKRKWIFSNKTSNRAHTHNAPTKIMHDINHLLAPDCAQGACLNRPNISKIAGKNHCYVALGRKADRIVVTLQWNGNFSIIVMPIQQQTSVDWLSTTTNQVPTSTKLTYQLELNMNALMFSYDGFMSHASICPCLAKLYMFVILNITYCYQRFLLIEYMWVLWMYNT